MKKILFATLIAAILTPVAHADQSAYVGLAIGNSSGTITLNNGTSTFFSTNSPAPVNGYVGYAFHPKFAVEGGITYYGAFEYDAPVEAVFGLFHAAVRGSMNLNNKWIVSGKVGLAMQRVDINPVNAASIRHEDTNPMLGAGMEYRFTDRFSATLDLVDYGRSKSQGMNMHVRTIEGGIKYRF